MRTVKLAPAVVVAALLSITLMPSCSGDSPSEDPAEGETEAIGTAASEVAWCQGWNGSGGPLQWCLTRCTVGSDKLRVVGTEGQVGGYGHCGQAADWFCAWNGWGNSSQACWGDCTYCG